jgi:hypothetical protein
MTFDSNGNDDPAGVEGDMIGMWDICLTENDENHRFTSEELVRARIDKGGGRRAYTANQYEEEMLPKLLKLQYIEKQPDNSFILTKIGKAHCRRLRENRIT